MARAHDIAEHYLGENGWEFLDEHPGRPIDWSRTNIARHLADDVWSIEGGFKLIAGILYGGDTLFIPWTGERTSTSNAAELRADRLEVAKDEVRHLLGAWSRSTSRGKAEAAPRELIEFALSQGYRPEWLDWAIERGLYVEERAPTPAAKMEAPPGKMPRVTIGKLAVRAAWKIECETGKRATASMVIECLQTWGDGDGYPELLEKIAHGVKWATKKGIEKNFDEETCGKTLEAWYASRK